MLKLIVFLKNRAAFYFYIENEFQFHISYLVVAGKVLSENILGYFFKTIETKKDVIMNTRKIFTLSLTLFACTALQASASDIKNYEQADGRNGGLLYDNFLKKGEVSAQFSNSFNVDTSAIKEKYDFFRCKQCHGWDRIGTEGYYGGRKPKAGKRPNVSRVNLLDNAKKMSPEEIFSKIKNPANSRSLSYDLSQYDPEGNEVVGDSMPAYGEIFNDSEIWDLVKFLKEDGEDYRNYYSMDIKGEYPDAKVTFVNIGKGGDVGSGNKVYTEFCASCHGADGTDIDIKGKSAGEFTRKKTYELAHKVKFGQPGSNMFGISLSVKEMNDLHKALADKTKYPDIKK
jgi:thiosulfate dehydrogenase